LKAQSNSMVKVICTALVAPDWSLIIYTKLLVSVGFVVTVPLREMLARILPPNVFLADHVCFSIGGVATLATNVEVTAEFISAALL